MIASVTNTKADTKAGLPFVSVIIPFYKNKLRLKESVSHCEKLDYPHFEIIIVGNTDQIVDGEKVRWLKIGDISQGSKKDTGIANARGEICAFIDDDAFPSKDWIKKAVKHFEDTAVGAVCGPGVAPSGENIREKASSSIWASYLGSGPARYRYVSTQLFVVDGTAPGYNLFVRRSLLIEIGSFRTKFRSGEDDIISDKIRNANKKIIYDPEVVVYHWRRPFFVPFFKQIFTYGMHRGFFSRHFSSGSKRGGLFFAFPLVHILVIVVALTVLFLGTPFLRLLSGLFLSVDLGVYLLLSFFSSFFASKSFLVSLLGMFGLPLTHFIYAVGYLKGITTSDLGEKPSH